MNDKLEGVLSYKELFTSYPNQWVLCKVLKREKNRISNVSVISNSMDKSAILLLAKELKKQGEDVAVVCTIEAMDDVNKFLFSGDEVESMEYVTAKEWAFIFQMAVGLPVSEEYLK